MVKTLELAVAKAAALPAAAQEEIARELLSRIEALGALQAALVQGVRELDRGEGEEIDIEEFISRIRRENDEE